jgi:2-polyprenyl-3-methyl-5-hydroxy-6-metoxy-1,4-benzoquinol methylase
LASLNEKMYSDLDPVVVDFLKQHGNQVFGVAASYTWWDDPKRMAFSLARYKFVAKMLEGLDKVVECGCADGFASRIVSQVVGSLVAVDICGPYIASAKQTAAGQWPITFKQHDLLAGPVEGSFDGAYSLDVLEHIEPKEEDRFISNIIAPLKEHGLCIIGMPSLQSQAYASKLSKQNHINCKDQRDFKNLMKKYFHVVLPFSANDEIVHTGYYAMSHYNLMVCTGKK